MSGSLGLSTEATAAAHATREDVAEALAGVLASGNDLEKCVAAQGLGRIGPAAASKALIAALRDPDEDVRIDAATAIVELNIDAALPVLVENIVEDPSLDAKLAYIAAVGSFREREAVPILRKLLQGLAEDEVAWDEEEMAQSGSDDWLEVQRGAVEALGRIGAEEAVDDVRAAIEDEFGQDLLLPGLKALAGMGPKGLAVVMDYLCSETARRRRTAVSVLSACAPETVVDLADDLLADPDPEVRLIAVEALPGGDPRLVDVLRDDDDEVRRAAVVRLVRVQPARLEIFLGDASDAVRVAALESFMALDDRPEIAGISEKLLDWLDKGAPALATAAARALPALAPEDCTPALRRAALRRGADGEVRRAAMRALALARPDVAIETLVTIARDPLRPIRLEAVGGLAHIAKSASGPDRERAREALLAALAGSLVLPPEGPGEDDVPASDQTSTNAAEESPVRHGGHAAKEDDVGQTNRIRIDREGNIIAEPPEGNAGEGAESADGELASQESEGEPSAFPLSTLEVLQDGLTSPAAEATEDGVQLTVEDLSFLELAQGRQGKRIRSPEQKSPAHADVRVLAARTLVDVPEPGVVEGLVAVLGENNDELRLAAAMSLAGLLENPDLLGEQAQPILARCLSDKSPTLRLWLTRAAAAKGAALIDALRARLADDDPSVRAEAVLGVSRSDVDFDPSPYLEDEDMAVRKRAGEALAERRGPDACPALLGLAFGHDGTDRLEAARLLRRADATAANAAVIDRLESADSPLVRRIAIEVLAEMNAAGRCEVLQDQSV